jgi:ABC-type transport system involved in multi-copper enzyme maturation permease subunit
MEQSTENEKSQIVSDSPKRNEEKPSYRRSLIFEGREILEILRYETKRLILTPKFYIALTLILLPAIFYLDASASQVEVILLDYGKETFMKRSAAGYVILGQFLMQLIAIMLTLDSFGTEAHESMQRYFAMPIRRANIFLGHSLTIFVGTTITGILSVLIFDLILWIWTGVGLSALLLLQAFFLTFIGAFLAIAITTMFIMIANYLNLNSTISLVPTLFLFYIIPFIVYFASQFQFMRTQLEKITFMHHLAVATDFMIEPLNGLQEILPTTDLRTAWLVLSLTIAFSEILAVIIFVKSEK